jgi:hypothetical protein
VRLARPAKELKAFAKVWLAPGEIKEVELILEDRAFAYWDPGQDDWQDVQALLPDMFNFLAPPLHAGSGDGRSMPVATTS